MSYVIQNFHIIESKLILNNRTRYLLWFNNTELVLSFYKFFHFRHFSNCYLFFQLPYKIYAHFFFYNRTLNFYKLISYKPGNLSNNFYLSTVYWNLVIINFLLKPQIVKNYCGNPIILSNQLWYSVKLNPSEINKTYYDKIIYLFFLFNHFLWSNFQKTYNISSTYLLINQLHFLNYFYNSLFFPIYNF